MTTLRTIGPLVGLLVVAACSSDGRSAPSSTAAAITAASGPESRPSATAIPPTPADTIAPPAGSTAPSRSEATNPVPEPPRAVDAEVCWSSTPQEGEQIAFDDGTERFGLVEPLVGMYGHAAAAGDVNGDAWTDLFVGTFADRDALDYAVRGATGPSPDRLLLGGPDGFRVDDTFPAGWGRTSGAVFADLDDDGDDDLVVARNQRGREGIGGRPTTVYANVGDRWVERTTLATGVGARSVAATDLDRDGIVDLVVAGDRYGEQPTTIYRGTGDLRFEDVTDRWGIPPDFVGLALATIDLDGDGWLDIVMNGDVRVLRGGSGGFTISDVPELAWETFGEEDDPAGIAVGDLDGDDRPDLVLGQHFNSTVDAGETVPVRILLNRSRPGALHLDDVTTESGSPPLRTKSPHVAIVDLDNDGRNDVVTSAASGTAASMSALPVVLRQIASIDGIPRFEKIGNEGDGEYYVTGITEDVDRDGRVDALMIAWRPEVASLLARNESASGSWLELDTAREPVAVGSEIAAIDPATGAVLARGWSASTTGYAAGASSVVHLGLGRAPTEVVLRVDDGGDTWEAIVPVDSRVSIDGCVG